MNQKIYTTRLFGLIFVVFCLSSHCWAQDAEAEADKVVSDSTEQAVDAKPKKKGIRFNFRYAPWKDVLEQFAEESGLSLILTSPPAGTFNYYKDPKFYTPAEAIDIMASVLVTEGFTLVRREGMLMVVNMEEELPPGLLTTITVDELADRGKFELSRCLFDLKNITAEEAEAEVQKIIGPLGTIEVLPKSKQLMVTEMGGRLRVIRDILRRIADPTALDASKVKTFAIENVSVEELLVPLREMLAIGEGQNVNDLGTIRMSTDPSGTKLLVSAAPNDLVRIQELIDLLDIPAPNTGEGTSVFDVPQLKVYSITDADPESSLQILQTLFLDDEDIRLATDPKTGNLVALATIEQHATIKTTLDQLQKDAREVEVIPLYAVDPQTAVLSINSLFGSGDEEGGTGSLRVEADLTNNNLMIRGTKAEIEQIRVLLNKMGEDEELYGTTSSRGPVRLISLSPREVDKVLDQLELVWPTIRPNKIRFVTPSNISRSLSPSGAVEERSIPRFEEDKKEPADDKKSEKDPDWNPLKEDSAKLENIDSNTTTFLTQVTREPTTEEKSDATKPTAPKSETGAEIIIAPGPNGIVISSKDLDALDAFEDLLATLTDDSDVTDKTFTIYNLKYETADTAAALLNEILGNGGGDTGGGGGGGGGLLGNLAGAALGGGGDGGGLLGSLLGGDSGGGITTSGSIKITPNVRLNHLVVEALPADLEIIDELLKVIDQNRSPEEVRTLPTPRAIQVVNTDANTIAEMIRGIYADRISGGGGQAQQPRPEDFIRALRGGGRGGRGGGGGQQDQEPVKITVAVDARNNRLIVAAPDPTFEEIKALVAQVDQINPQSAESTHIVPIKNADPALIQRALAAIIGSQSATAASSQSSNGRGGGSTGRGGAAGQPQRGGGAEQAQRQAEFFRAIQQRAAAQGGRGGGQGGRGGGQGGRGGRGGGDTGGRGGRGGRGG